MTFDRPRWLFRRLLVFVITIILSPLSGCGTSPQIAPITEANPVASQRVKQHVVSVGDTVFSIALRYDLDYKKLSELNGLGIDYKIYPGQILSLNVDAVHTTPTAVVRTVTPPQKAQQATPPRSVNRTVSVASPAPAPHSLGSISWRWPINGKVLASFNPHVGLNKGIDIQGKLGEPVVSAADGEVVYSGSGLRGYGKLLIVKHNQKFLSAYAHNRVLHVSEGDLVKAGQKIAEVGLSGTNSARLHFEIRMDGKPVNPLHHLPRR
jgi:lipoprotein NlpD